MRVNLLVAGCLAATLASSAMAAPVTGQIAVYDGNSLLGYVSRFYDAQNSYTYTSLLADALEVSLDPLVSLFAISTLNEPVSDRYFGAVGGRVSYHMGSGLPGYAYLSGTSLTPAGATPVPPRDAIHDIEVLGYHAPSESTIWRLMGDELMAQWVNTDGTLVADTTIFYNGLINVLDLTGDLAAFNAMFPNEKTRRVTFRFTGASPNNVPEPMSLGLVGIGLVVLALLRRKPAGRGKNDGRQGKVPAAVPPGIEVPMASFQDRAGCLAIGWPAKRRDAPAGGVTPPESIPPSGGRVRPSATPP